MCTGPVNNVKIQGAVKRKGLYVDRIVGINVTEDDLKGFLSTTVEEDSITVKKLPTKGSNWAISVGTQNNDV